MIIPRYFSIYLPELAVGGKDLDNVCYSSVLFKKRNDVTTAEIAVIAHV
jgi:hypothetical protein